MSAAHLVTPCLRRAACTRGALGAAGGVDGAHAHCSRLLRRYPFHWHIAGDQPSSYVTDCSIHTSHYRCVVLHGTHEVTVARNVAVDITGHCFYLEDGVEERNVIEYNLAAWVHVIGSGATEGGQEGQLFHESAALRQPADAGASGFYITNACVAGRRLGPTRRRCKQSPLPSFVRRAMAAGTTTSEATRRVVAGAASAL